MHLYSYMLVRARPRYTMPRKQRTTPSDGSGRIYSSWPTSKVETSYPKLKVELSQVWLKGIV